jgi:hypothetical protein
MQHYDTQETCEANDRFEPDPGSKHAGKANDVVVAKDGGVRADETNPCQKLAPMDDRARRAGRADQRHRAAGPGGDGRGREARSRGVSLCDRLK